MSNELRVKLPLKTRICNPRLITGLLLLLGISSNSFASESLLQGTIVGLTQRPISAGHIAIAVGDSVYAEVDLLPDGSFVVPNLSPGSVYQITFSDTWGIDHVLAAFQMTDDSIGPITFQARGGRLRVLSIVKPIVEEPGDRFAVGGGTVFVLGSGFNGDFDVRPGFLLELSFQEYVHRIPLLGAPAPRNYWEYALSAWSNRYAGLTQRVDPAQAPGDASYARIRVSTGPVFRSEAGRAEMAFGVSGAIGGILDGGKILETTREGRFSVNSFGLYLRGGIGIALGAINMIVYSRADILQTVSGHDAEYWSGSVTELSLGLRFQ